MIQKTATRVERTQLLNLYLPIMARVTLLERVKIADVLKAGTSEEVLEWTAWCREKINEIQKQHAEKEA